MPTKKLQEKMTVLRKNNLLKANENCRSHFSSYGFCHIWSIYFFGFLLVTQLPQATPKITHNFACKYLRKAEECDDFLSKSFSAVQKSNETFCPGEFSQFGCWPYSTLGVVEVNCSDFFGQAKENAKMMRFCTKDGTWYKDDITNETWLHDLDCSFINDSELDQEPVKESEQMEMLNIFRIIYTIGFATSFVSLTIALITFSYFRKLHCVRNYIHMNMMLSFFVRYICILINDRVIFEHYNLDRFEDINIETLKIYCPDYDGISGSMIACRLAIVFMYYGILANYFWLLAEGIYLQIILLFPMTTNKENKHFSLYMAGSWGIPWIFVGLWTVLRLIFDSDGCWVESESKLIMWIIRVPVIFSIAINFIVFVNVIRLIISKLRAHNLKRNDYKLTLAKSTLALIPLLGIHYIVFLFITDDYIESDSPVMKIKIGFETILTSFQGTLIAIFYCFLNGEVQGVVIKRWKTLRLKNGLPTTTLRKELTQNTNQTILMTSSDCKSQIAQETALLFPNNHVSGTRLKSSSSEVEMTIMKCNSFSSFAKTPPKNESLF